MPRFRKAFSLLLLSSMVLSSPSAFANDDPDVDPDRYEFSALPIFMADTDRGFITGATGLVVRFKKGYYPYRWRMQLLTRFSVERQPDDTLQLPFHEYRLRFDIPGVLTPRLRLDAEVAFRRYTDSGYYGFGNDSPGENGVDRFNEYDRVYPSALVQARYTFSKHLSFLVGLSFTYNWLELYEDSKLRTDTQSLDPKVRDLLHGTEDHALTITSLGLVWDTRDHEFSPTRGMFHELSWRLSPGLELLYGGANATARFFYPLLGEKLVVASRLVLDFIVGDAPLYELSRFGSLTPQDGIGGAQAIRGVPLQRYHGKIKALANVELRSELVAFHLLSQRFKLGFLAFVDMGRLWSDYEALQRFDGDGLGLKLGLGGGSRLRWGETFVLRFDLAWSPDADPVGAYIGFNHVF
ncbi:MAG: BamA/TamA family outer membrane protein [Deltaproteobacteria bacterium]|nr:BamA/TamA family outer membrane protein [Deltaproteobacteria bacterium]